jgi:hypothetical protein
MIETRLLSMEAEEGTLYSEYRVIMGKDRAYEGLSLILSSLP